MESTPKERQKNRPFRPLCPPGLVLRRAASHLHYASTAFLAAALISAYPLAKLRISINWSRLLSGYWLGLGVRSTVVAAVLCVIGFPLQETLLPLWRRCWAQKPRLLAAALFASLTVGVFGWSVGLVLAVFTITLLEFFDRLDGDTVRLGGAACRLAIPAAYMFVGLVLVFSYNDLIASAKFAASYDAVFNRIDAMLLRGWTVSQMARAVMPRLPLGSFHVLQIIYWGMLEQVGAALVITAVCLGQRRALAFVGTLLTAYYLALVVFFIWPSMGPFAIRPGLLPGLPEPEPDGIYSIQKAYVLKAVLLSTHRLGIRVDTDYYIGFPSMHIVLAMVVLWFLRKWRRIALTLLGYDAAMLVAIILLEEHYVVDLLGGAALAVAAIAMVNPMTSERQVPDGAAGG